MEYINGLTEYLKRKGYELEPDTRPDTRKGPMATPAYDLKVWKLINE